MDAAERLSTYLCDQGEQVAAEPICRRIIEMDRCHEHAHRLLMRCYLGRGERALAIRQYQSCPEGLRTELGIAPTDETRSLFDTIMRESKRDALRIPQMVPGLSES